MNNLMTEVREQVEQPEPERAIAPPVSYQHAAVIVAHPDDETLWCGGLILAHPNYDWFIVTTCRKSDSDRSEKFFRALQTYGAVGAMGDLDDGPEQSPLLQQDLERSVLELLPAVPYELILTHAPGGEYTSHRRHEEVSQSITHLWNAGAISTKELWQFAYEDGGGGELPQAIETAHRCDLLPNQIWQEKYRLITEIYGFSPNSWEACTTPKTEAFWCFTSPVVLLEHIKRQRQPR